MMRTILGIVAGVVVFVVVVSLMDGLAHHLHPFPDEGGNFDDPVVWAAHVATTPTWIMLIVLSGWILGTFGGSLTAAAINTSRRLLVVAVIAALAEAGTIMNAMMLPHPLWMTAAGVLLIPIAAIASLLLIRSE